MYNKAKESIRPFTIIIYIIKVISVSGLYFVIFFSLLPAFVSAQIVINEVSSGSSSDWVELYNTGTSSADLSSYIIRDSTDSNKKELIGNLDPGAWISFNFSQWLNNSGDVVKLIRLDNGQEQIVDKISYGDGGEICAPSDSQSIGRQPDGPGPLVRFSSTSRDSSNNISQDPCPSPSPTVTLTPTSTPTSAPTPTVTRAPTATVTPSPTLTPSPSLVTTKSPTPSPSVTPEPTPVGVVLGVVADPPATSSATSFSVKPLIISLLFVASGLALLSFVFVFKRYQKLKNETSV